MSYNSTTDYLNLLDSLVANETIPDAVVDQLMGYVKSIYHSDLENNYSKPMLWIGMYIALASLLCILAMVADLLHGLRNRKLWFPCKYFSVNAASLSVISVAMKLPVDLSGSMPGDVDQAAKLGSMAFICTMMANLLPSLAAMNNNELLTNITALGVLVITLAVNVCIQINTGVVSYKEDAQLAQTVAKQVDLKTLGITNKHRNVIIATVYVTVLLVLLMIHVCSSLAILRSKQIIESKYKKGHEIALKDVQQPSEELVTVERLEKHVRNHWIMAGSGSPQFIAACSATTMASGVICAIPAVLHTLTMCWTIKAIFEKEYDSDYGWSMLVILIVQFMGVIVGTIAPFSRCFAALSLKVSIKSNLKYLNVCYVESYWRWKLSDWKEGTGSMPFTYRSHKLKAVILYSRNLILNLCIQFQEAVVVVCKTVALIPFFFMICVVYSFRFLKWLFKIAFRFPMDTRAEQTQDLSQYVLQLEDETELAERTLVGLSKSAKRLMRKGENKKPNDLHFLKVQDNPFQEVLNFDDIDRVPSLLLKEFQDCWSVPVVTLTTIALSLPNIEENQVDSFLKSVRAGLEYVMLVEESLNVGDDYASVQKAAKTLWLEVDVRRKWLREDLTLKRSDQVDWFKNKAKDMVIAEKESTENGGPDDDPIHRLICANSMYRITKTILLLYNNNINADMVSPEQMFGKISSMIDDIMAACFTNLPQVIVKKCHSEIEKREASVQGAAQLLGETKQIINAVQQLQRLHKEQHHSSMNPNDLPFIDKWRAYLAGLRNP